MKDGVWRTVGGRRIFIKEGQSLSDAMRNSGKFDKNKIELEQLKQDDFKVNKDDTDYMKDIKRSLKSDYKYLEKLEEHLKKLEEKKEELIKGNGKEAYNEVLRMSKDDIDFQKENMEYAEKEYIKELKKQNKK